MHRSILRDLPKLTHLLNGGAALREHGFSYEKAHADHLRQRAQMAREYPQADALAVFDSVISTCAEQWGLPLPGPDAAERFGRGVL